MDSSKVLYSQGSNDECYTPRYGVIPIIKYVADYEYRLYIKNNQTSKRNLIVWCPFDKEESEFVKELKKLVFIDVVYSHIDNGQDFFKYEPKEWDIIVSNPPFSNKRKFFERALSFNKPFALLMTNTWLNDSAPKQLFKEKELQLLMFDNRMLFYNNGHINDKITFSSSYYCYNFLPKQIIMEHIMSPTEFKKQENKKEKINEPTTTTN